MSIRKIPKKYNSIVLGVLTPVVMGFMMSFVATWMNLGFVPSFLSKWMLAYTGVLVIGVPVGFVVIPPLKALVDRITE